MLGNNRITSGSDLNIILLPYRSPRASMVHFVDYRLINRSKSMEEFLFFNKISTELSTRFESDLVYHKIFRHYFYLEIYLQLILVDVL